MLEQSEKTMIAEAMLRVEERLTEATSSHVALIPKLARNLLGAGGKRLRARITICSALGCGYAGNSHIGLASSVEMMHTATLFHDDVVDEADSRRSAPTARSTAGNAAAVLVGDFLLGQAFRLMVATESVPALRILSDSAAEMAQGEVAQLAAKSNVHLSQQAYIAIISAKTATLFKAAAEAGACIAEASDDTRKTLARFGLNIGIAFQLMDDLLDYDGKAAVTGKAIGTDFREQKVTLPVLLAIKANADLGSARDSSQDEFWLRAFTGQQQDETDYATALRLIEQHGTLEMTRKLAQQYTKAATEELDRLPQNCWIDDLRLSATAGLGRKG